MSANTQKIDQLLEKIIALHIIGTIGVESIASGSFGKFHDAERQAKNPQSDVNPSTPTPEVDEAMVEINASKEIPPDIALLVGLNAELPPDSPILKIRALAAAFIMSLHELKAMPSSTLGGALIREVHLGYAQESILSALRATDCATM